MERPLKPSQAAQRAHGTPRQSEKDQAGGAIGSTGEFGGSHEHYISHGAPQKTKVSTFGG